MSKEAKILFSIGGITIIILVIIGFIFGGNEANKATIDTAILVSNDSQIIKAKGKEKAVVVEFSDFQCPACSAAETTMSDLRKKYAENVTFVYRHFPLVSHPYSTTAALAAEASAAQGKFWEMHDKLFNQQEEWGSLSNSLDAATVREKIINYATELGLNVNQFTQDLDDQKYLSVINQGKADGTKANITGTPSFFVNGQPTELNVLEQTISEVIK